MLFWWDMCGEERDLVGRGNGVYGGGGSRVVVVVAAAAETAVAVVMVVVTAELFGCTVGGAGGVKRKGPLGKAAVVVEEARLRGWVLWPPDDDDASARLRTVGEMLARGRGREMVVVVGSEPDVGLV